MRVSLMMFALGWMISFPLGAIEPDPAEALTARLVDAFNAGDSAAIEADCTASFWASEDGPEAELIREGYGSGTRRWLMRQEEVRTAADQVPGRAAATIVLLSAEKKTPVDAVYFYAQELDGTWVWTGFNEDKDFRRAFLAGLIDGSFDPATLPSDSGLESLGDRLEPLFSLLGEGGYSVENRWDERLQRGALVVTLPPDEYGDAESAVLYFRKTDEGWVLTGSAYGLFASAFLGY